MSQSPNIIITSVKPEDYTQWLPYWLSYQEFYQVQLADEVTAATWKRFFDENVPVYCAVAREGEKILGFAHYLFHDSTWGINNFCYLEDLFVDPATRGKHIGKKLIQYVKEKAQAKNSDRFYWHTQESNKVAQRLYNWVAEEPGVIEYRMTL
ncbi:MAG: GNAT family N-acetyltransferase [Gammaproteobacteria bacterium]|nr:GNAT family N-acetyltransferase [Gammaproteobacteria bacterium]MBU1468959.1 GNAT family N-acetyltransferase [Gammaproteobacteria bacterium]MBU2023633.1 GNAT family N-acetyltransferase [Gammaproteobacteria bacterium]MBU2240177.1 GNAT family N-acetyltransferase [Gammaproteobacteria bacterium]MBU2321028.1 GNAT family N-acetyltransferase [Gammaproteobacteria bacterium]